MNFGIRLSCILALLFCLASTGIAGVFNQVSDLQRIHQLVHLSKQATNPVARLQTFYDILRIYKRFRGGPLSDLEKETKFNRDLAEFELYNGPVEGLVSDFPQSYMIRHLEEIIANMKIRSLQALIDDISKYLRENMWCLTRK